MAPSCWFFWALWLPLVLSVAVAEERVEGCSDSAKRCGSMSISDPFWLRDNETEPACGSSDFEVTCQNNTSVLRSSMTSGYGFDIMNISYEERRLHVADEGKLLLLLHASNSCQVAMWNTSAKLSIPFTINRGSPNLILYNCTEVGAAAAVARRDRGLVKTGVRCRNESKVFARAGVPYDTTGNYAGYALDGCEAIVVPVLGSSGKTKAGEYERLINDGFLLTWEPPCKFTCQLIS